jgi:aryl-phospho-beta-D-glucosidase BglC (GH1 family)
MTTRKQMIKKMSVWGSVLAALVVLMGCVPPPMPRPVATDQPVPTPIPSTPTAAPPLTPLTEVPTARLQHLSKAVNITRWFWYPEGSGQSYWENYVTDADLKLIREMGVLSVRLVISPTFFYQVNDPATLNPDMIGYLDKAVDRLLAADLAVVIDMHDQDKDAWHFKPTYVDGFITYWQVLAKRYAGRDPDRVMFEMLNEPVFPNEAERWQKIQARWVQAMRQVAPNHTLIVTGNEWGGISGLRKLNPLDDKNLVYSFHFYDPFQFTHQGATWAGPGLEELKDIPYPATPERCKDMLEKITDSLEKQRMRNFCLSYETASKTKNRLAEAADWGKANNAPLWLGEFGVYCPNAPVADRAQWINDVRQAAEAFKIGWSLWGYDECFGLQRKLLTNGEIQIDTDVAKALGLKVP